MFILCESCKCSVFLSNIKILRMKISIPTSWEEMNEWQQEEVIHILQNYSEGDFEDSIIRIISVLLMKSNNIIQYFRMRNILRDIPLSAFEEHLRFIYEPPKLYQFPKISRLKKPADRIGDISIRQFSVCETLLYRWREAKGEKKYLLMRQLVACLYRLGDNYNEQLLPDIARKTDKIPFKKAQRIVFIFSCVCRYIADIDPSIFAKSDSKTPAPQKHTSFSKIITMMAADELRLLGNLKECQNTLVYDFFNSFLESKRIHEQRAKALKQF